MRTFARYQASSCEERAATTAPTIYVYTHTHLSIYLAIYIYICTFARYQASSCEKRAATTAPTFGSKATARGGPEQEAASFSCRIKKKNVYVG